MAITSKIEKRGTEDIFNVEFNNGTLEQLRELAVFLKEDGFTFSDDESEKLKEVVRLGIAWLETVKERKSKERVVNE